MIIYLILFLEFFLIGLFTFGGGYAMIPLIKDLVLKYEWLSESEFYSFLGICESTPGPIAINMATFIGTNQGGLLGAIVATLGVVLPSFTIIILVASLFKKFIKNKYFQYFLHGIKPVVVGLILATGSMLLIKSIGFESLNIFNFNLNSSIIFVIIVLIYNLTKIIYKKKINTIMLILISAGLGLLIFII